MNEESAAVDLICPTELRTGQNAKEAKGMQK